MKWITDLFSSGISAGDSTANTQLQNQQQQLQHTTNSSQLTAPVNAAGTVTLTSGNTIFVSNGGSVSWTNTQYNSAPWEYKEETKNRYSKDLIDLIVKIRSEIGSSSQLHVPMGHPYPEDKVAEAINQYVTEQKFKTKLETIVNE